MNTDKKPAWILYHTEAGNVNMEQTKVTGGGMGQHENPYDQSQPYIPKRIMFQSREKFRHVFVF